MGADSQVTYTEQNALSDNDLKLFYENGVLGGFAGYAEQAALYRTFVRNLEDEDITQVQTLPGMIALSKKFNEFLEAEGTALTKGDEIIGHVLLATTSAAYAIEDKYIKAIDNYAIIGSGELSARPLMEYGASVHAALDAACKFNIYCSYPLVFIELNRKTGNVRRTMIEYPTNNVKADNKLFA